ncbi:hypothetical protein MTR67_034773 [Solanum verrucosum]|uniref:Integrase zinc-binding domain-containing protein n=1 Tax=Solanum verrucosum TaxID=315347 RepID=A0AAF0ZKT6_SOLVR|nr:hypothetical protein MTR67_034773 [Solanum verrucosum]
MNVMYYPGKANVVVDSLSRLSMGSVAHVKNGSESSLAVEVKEKQDSDPILVQLKGVVHQQKVERDLREVFWWSDMKRDIADFVATCPNCQYVKVEHQKQGGLPRTQGQHASIWVIVDRVSKSAHFLAVKTTDSAKDYAKLYIGPHLVDQVMEKVKFIQERLKTTQSRQKSYTDVRRRDLEFEVYDWVYLKVLPMKGVMRFGKKEKLSPRYMGPYTISKRISTVAYELELPQELAVVHPVFQIFMLIK